MAIQLRRAASFTASAVLDLEQVAPPFTVTVIPGSGNTCLVETSITPGAAANPGGAVWLPWELGAVTATAGDVFTGPLTALRFTRTAGSASNGYEVAA